jgi:exopolyphosphatase/guanosine-5'-triphosphate,3'-diphosphate pyrophosphatase
MAELTEVVADGKKTRALAIEFEDSGWVIAAVGELGLERFENINYPRGLKQLVGMKG